MKYTPVIIGYNGDQDLLPYCLTSMQKHCSNFAKPIIVWDDFVRERPIDFDQLRQTTGCDFSVIKHTELLDWPDSLSKWGWVRQQLAKLLCYQYVSTPYTYIIDADVLFVGTPELFDQNKPILRQDTDKTVPNDYKFFMQNYLDMREFNNFTYVGSTAMWDNSLVEKIFDLCVEKSNLSLIDAVDHMITHDKHPELPFSEFEIYGHAVSLFDYNSHTIKNRNWYSCAWHETDCSSDIILDWKLLAEKNNIPLDQTAELLQKT